MAVSSFMALSFMIMSFIPFIMFLTAMIKYTPFTYGMLRQGILSVIPENLQEFVMGVVVEVYERNTTVYSVTSILVAIWSAGKGLMALINGLNSIYHVHETRNWLIRRIQAAFYKAWWNRYTWQYIEYQVVNGGKAVIHNGRTKRTGRYWNY